MKKIKFGLTLLIAYFMYFQLEAQNLVLNPSFEDTIPCSQWPPPNFSCAGPCMTPPWFQPSFGSPDYINAYYSPSCGGGGGNYPAYYDDTRGYQLPKSGFGMEGFAAFVADLTPPGQREMLEGRLSSPLLSGHEYCVSYFISLSNNSDHAIWSIGIYFSTDSILELDSIIGKSPQVLNIQGNHLIDTLNWVQITDSFIASGGEEYFLIGNFRSNNNTDSIHVVPENAIIGFQNVAYYYVDDFNVIDCTVGIEGINQISTVPIHPNPAYEEIRFKVEIDGASESYYYITDLSGRKIKSGKLTNNTLEHKISVQELPKGMYFIVVRNTTNLVARGRFIKY